jgi:hypothetical protein
MSSILGEGGPDTVAADVKLELPGNAFTPDTKVGAGGVYVLPDVAFVSAVAFATVKTRARATALWKAETLRLRVFMVIASSGRGS